MYENPNAPTKIEISGPFDQRMLKHINSSITGPEEMFGIDKTLMKIASQQDAENSNSNDFSAAAAASSIADDEECHAKKLCLQSKQREICYLQMLWKIMILTRESKFQMIRTM